MNELIVKSKKEFENENYEKSMEYLEGVGSEDECYEFAQYIKASCLMRLKKYNDALEVFDDLISSDPYSELFWIDKVYCHIFLKEESKAVRALDELDRISDKSDKSLLVQVARLNYLVKDYDRALIYCDYALAIDSDYKDALYEKAVILMKLEDGEKISEISNKLAGLSEDSPLGYVPVFLINLFSKNYRACVELIGNLNSEFSEEHIEMLKSIIFKQICEDNCVNLLVVNGEEFPIDDVLEVMLDFVENGKDSGEIGQAHYFVL